MNTHWIRSTVIAGLALVFAPIGGAAAGSFPGQPFSEYGVVDDASQKGLLIVSDTAFQLGDKVSVNKLNGRPASASDLKPGTKVGFNVYGERPNQYISEIWVLPTTFNPSATGGPVALPGIGPVGQD